ncbi:MAG: T9SS type A sorting domain-containing protein [Aureispira sp.]
MLIRYSIFLFLFLIITTSKAQNVFNKRIQLGCAQTIFTGLEATDSCYYVSGIARDTINCTIGVFLLKLDTLGNEILHKIYTGGDRKIEMWHTGIKTDVDGTLIGGGETFDTAQIRTMLFKFDANGDTLWTRQYIDPSNPTGIYTRTDELVIAPDSSYLLASQTNTTDSNSFVVMQIERDGSIRWHKNFGYDWNYCINHSIVPLEDGFVMGYSNTDHNKTPIDYTTLCQIKKMDYSGNVLWEWQNDSSIQIEGANDLIQTKDKGWVIGTVIGKEILSTGGTSSIFSRESYVFKLDSARNWLWGTPLRGYSSTAYSKVMKVIEQSDSSLMTFGITADTFTNNGVLVGEYNALVARLSVDGDSLWSHQYRYMQQAWAEHEIFDVEQTQDGGYLIAGQALFSGQGQYQQGWLLKLDEHGCLVPGCHIDSSRIGILPIGVQPQAELKLYPNPATDYLNVLYRNQQTGQKLTFRILDEQGRILKTYNTSDVSDKTYVFPVWELLSGWYVLEVRQDGKLIGSEVFIKQ